MANSSLPQTSVVQQYFTNKSGPHIFWTFIFLILVCLFFLMYFLVVMLSIFFTNPQLRDSARYIFFIYMLVNDMLYLLLGLTLMLGVVYFLYIPVPLCFILYTVSSMAFRVTPPTLAAMAIEKYIAICHPLQYPVLCTPHKTNLAFTFICAVQLIPYVAELSLMSLSLTNIFNINVICRKERLIVNPIQTVLRNTVHVWVFASGAMVILFTYVKITMVARRVGSQSSFATKARKTILLHAFQLLLCMTSLLSILTDGIPATQVELVPLFNFLVFTCVPRFLSPLIYGMRDEYLRKILKKFLTRDSKPLNDRET